MEKRPIQNSNFEKLLRDQLQQVNEQPEDNTWQEIARQQGPKNTWLRLRYYGSYAVPVLALLILGGLLWRSASSKDEAPMAKPGMETPAGQPQKDQVLPPMAGTEQTAGFPENQAAPHTEVYPKKAVYPASAQFSPRPNTVPASTIRFQSEEGVRYQNPVSGSSIYIPANSLVTASGRPVTGEVELQFREYRSFADFLAAGIPMHYGDKRGEFFFNSGGMFEARVSQDGAPLEMAAGKEYEVNFVPTDRLTKPSLYYFDQTNNTWQYQPDSAFASVHGQKVQSLPEIVNQEVAIRDNTNGRGVNCLPIMPAKTPAQPSEYVSEGVSAGYDLATGKMKMPTWFRNRPEMTLQQVMATAERGHIRIVRDVDKVEQLFPEDADNVFSELKAFKNCYFMRRLDSVQNIQTDAKLNREQYWNSIVIYKDKGSTCHITLYSDNDMLKFYADLLPSMGNTRFDFNKVMGEYQRLRTQRQDNLEENYKRLVYFMALAPAFQTEQEWCMTQADWVAYFDNNRPLMRERYGDLVKAGNTSNPTVATATWREWYSRLRDLHFDKGENARPSDSKREKLSNLAYALRLTRFGVFNCDQIFRLANGGKLEYVQANYQTADGRSIDPVSTTLLDHDNKLFLSMPRVDLIPRTTNKTIDLVLTDRNGRTYHVPIENYRRSITSSLNATMTALDVTDETRSPKDWAKVLNL